MALRYDILPAEQRHLVPKLAPLTQIGFVLYGGTAIALQLGHRVSIDFDFFSDRPLAQGEILQAMPSLLNAPVIQDELETWTVLNADLESGLPVKVSFFGNLRFGRVGEPLCGGTLTLASLDDLMAHKLKVLLQRAETKDYQDIAAMLRAGQTLEDGMGSAIALFPSFPPGEAIKALVYFSDGNLGTVSQRDRATLIEHVDRFSTPTSVSIVSTRLSP